METVTVEGLTAELAAMRSEYAVLVESTQIAEDSIDMHRINEGVSDFLKKAYAVVCEYAKKVYAKIKQICRFIIRKISEYVTRALATVIGFVGFKVSGKDMYRLQELPPIIEKQIYLVESHSMKTPWEDFVKEMREIDQRLSDISQNAARQSGDMEVVKIRVVRFYANTVSKLQETLIRAVNKLESELMRGLGQDQYDADAEKRISMMRSKAGLTNRITEHVVSLGTLIGRLLQMARINK